MENLASILAVLIFIGMFVMIVQGKYQRHNITLVSGGLVIVFVLGLCLQDMGAIMEVLSLHSFIEPLFWFGEGELSSVGINWATIIFIAGMMIMVEGLGEAGFFRWLCLLMARGGPLPHNTAFDMLYVHFCCACHVYRQYYRGSVPCGGDLGFSQAAEV